MWKQRCVLRHETRVSVSLQRWLLRWWNPLQRSVHSPANSVNFVSFLQYLHAFLFSSQTRTSATSTTTSVRSNAATFREASTAAARLASLLPQTSATAWVSVTSHAHRHLICLYQLVLIIFPRFVSLMWSQWSEHCTRGLHALRFCDVIRSVFALTTVRLFLDVNECATNNGGCEHDCVNVPGSFHCKCRHGQVLAADGLTCGQTTFQTFSSLHAWI